METVILSQVCCHFLIIFFKIASKDTKGGGYTKNKGSSWRHQKLLTKIQIKNNPPRGLYFQIRGTALSPVITVILDGIAEIRYHGNDFYILWKKTEKMRMNILNIEHIHKIFGDKVIFDDISCGIDQGEKIGIIGVNGTGKTTLLRVIAGEEEPDEGQVITQNGIRISWLPQTPEFPQHMTILDYVAEGKWQKDWSTESEARRMLNTLGITDQNINMDNLSGGEKKRVALARMLLNPADILILDEPTNHLDGEMVIWLEDFLRNFRGTVIMVTHDRYFLDRVANRILEISHGKLYSYAGDYSRFLELKAQREEMELASDRKRRSVLRMELEWAARGCRARSTKQRARLDRLEALKAGKTPLKEQNVEMDSIETRMGKKTIEFHHVSKTIEGRLLINDFDHIVLRDQRLGIIGPNGCGKSTLLKMADGLILPDSGEIQIGETIRIGYLAQNVPDMDGRQRVIDYIREVAEYVPTKEGRITASQMLERFLFDPAMQYTPVEKLSGGEKRRLYLLKVLMEAPNVLLLDEPGNDLDIPTMTILEDYLDSFSGIVITVSHDRYFLDNVVNRIMAFEGDGRLVQYEGGYTDYLEAKERKGQSLETRSDMNGGTVQGETAEPEKKKSAADTWKQSRKQKLKFTYKEQKEFDTIDDDIAALEERLEQIDKEMAANATNAGKLRELSDEQQEIQQKLDEKMDRWVYLNDLAEQIENQKE